MGPGELADQAGKKAEELTAEEVERLMSDPQIRELQYKLAHGGDRFKLEVTNEAPREIRNVRVPEGASEGERAEAVREAMAEQQRNEQRDADAAALRKRKEHDERMARSDAWAYVLAGAGTESVNGRYARNGEGVKNGARVYIGPNGFSLSREVVGGGEGWIVGKMPRAYYAYQTSDTMAPSSGWAVQEHGVAPAPTVVVIEPLDAVEGAKSAGNAAFGEGDYAAAVSKYTEALSIASACASAHGIDETLLGKIHANRAEVPRYLPRPRSTRSCCDALLLWQAHLRSENFAEAEADADTALEYDPCAVKVLLWRLLLWRLLLWPVPFAVRACVCPLVLCRRMCARRRRCTVPGITRAPKPLSRTLSRCDLRIRR